MKNLLLILFLFPVFAKAQDKLMVQGTGKDIYINHTVAPKENFYSIGRFYSISPKEIAPFNNVTLETGVTIGQTIKIPLSKSNFIQSEDAGGKAVYHKVESKETFYRLSTNYNKVSVSALKKWNNITGDELPNGADIIVGYIKGNNAVAANNAPAVIESEEKAKVKSIKEKKKEEEKIAVTRTVETEPNIPEVSLNTGNAKNFKGGVFKTLFKNSGKEDAGTAGVFKSTSGWEDGKYYCLHNSAPQGAIVKITNTANDKFIFAKVLDVMPDLGQNNGLALRLSNAAADALGAGTDNFNCSINF